MRTPLYAGIAVLCILLAGCAQPLEMPESLSTGGSNGSPDAPPGLEDVLSAKPFPDVAGNASMRVEFLDVGQADATVVHIEGVTILVDAGDRHEASWSAVVDHLHADGLERLDVLVLTHPDADHVGGCDEILAAFDVAWILHPGIPKDTRTWEACAEAIEQEAALELTDAELAPGMYLNASRHASIQVTHVDASRVRDPNQGSIVLRVSLGDTDTLLTGDIGCETEQRILDEGYAVEAEILKVAHHGSASSSCDAFLRATQPELAIISAGENPYGHPHPDALERLRSAGATILRTDTEGTIVIEAGSRSYRDAS